MKTEIKILIFSFVLFSWTILVLSFYMNDNFERPILLGTSILSALCSVIAIVLAAMFYDRLGYDRKLAEKKIDKVIEILEELKEMRVRVNCKIDSVSRSFPINMKKICLNLDTENLNIV